MRVRDACQHDVSSVPRLRAPRATRAVVLYSQLSARGQEKYGYRHSTHSSGKFTKMRVVFVYTTMFHPVNR